MSEPVAPWDGMSPWEWAIADLRHEAMMPIRKLQSQGLEFEAPDHWIIAQYTGLLMRLALLDVQNASSFEHFRAMWRCDLGPAVEPFILPLYLAAVTRKLDEEIRYDMARHAVDAAEMIAQAD